MVPRCGRPWNAAVRSRPLDCGVVRIGEQTGRLPETLDFLREYYRKRAAQRKMLSSAVSYPLVILSTAVVVVAFMLAVIVPMFEQVYARMGGELPRTHAVDHCPVEIISCLCRHDHRIGGLPHIASYISNRNPKGGATMDF